MINISSWSVLGFLFGLLIFVGALIIVGIIEGWRQRKKRQKLFAQSEAEKEQPKEQKEDFYKILTTYRPKDTLIDALSRMLAGEQNINTEKK